MSKRGYADYPERIPPGWRVASVEYWPINNPYSSHKADFEIENWRFRTYGEVENPLELTYEEFRSLPHVSKTLDHHCVDGWSYLGQSWNGVDISVIKEKTGVRGSARYLIVEGARTASQRFPIEQDLLLADGQSGSTLSRAAGYPLRLVAPGEFGFKSRKWIDGIKFCASAEVDGFDKGLMEDGIYEHYSEKVSSFNPWTVDNNERKSFLRNNFTADTERARRKKKEEHLLEHHHGAPLTDADAFQLCSLEELKESKVGLKFVVNGSEILLVLSRGKVYAVEPICTHIGSDLSRGKVNRDAGTVKCPLHGAVFDVANGACLSASYGAEGDAFPAIRTYKIRVDRDAISVERNQKWGPIW
jgi:nitrite reductase/ring-hydroxylating ferredoxin subunit